MGYDATPPALHLPPRSRREQRIWLIGDAPPDEPGLLRLDVLPDSHDSFSSLRAVMRQLAPYAAAPQLQRLRELDELLHDACPRLDDATSGGGRGEMLTDSVASAVMRRISRESVYTAVVIDEAARLANDILDSLPDCSRVYVRHVDRLDRPSIKVLARAMLLLEPSHRFGWVWHSEADPIDLGRSAATTDPYLASRSQLMQQLVAMLEPRLVRNGSATCLHHPPTEARSTLDVSAALVVQNYDACLLWCNRAADGVVEQAELLRLAGLALVNVGDQQAALERFAAAENLASGPGRRAHLAYLQGLVESKRCYDLTESARHYDRGLAHLDRAGEHVPAAEDLALERGWLLNGLALIEALRWRRNPSNTDGNRRSFELVEEAFGLVASGDDPARTYLRFNLVANAALLVEMAGDHDAAIDIFTRAFDHGGVQSARLMNRWNTVLGYRLGVLELRAGKMAGARDRLAQAAQSATSVGSWPMQERILRALGATELACGELGAAETAFRAGLELCRAARSAEGTRDHARGLIAVEIARGRPDVAADVRRQLLETERLDVADGATSDGADAGLIEPRPASPKLPAYLPEIDLEGIPPVDINRYLVTAQSPAEERAHPWRS